ncbi:SRPBCC domain-containing protein [Aquimarina sp. D1M17]|uniref:SRPBCC domain-containing protein n=1 Tax=Aquimarina acroporae TaxID=2937283 RepID=UPI0020BE1C59|nr:SRPBCC domain-containing protein [Aquimarina acroporae]MCK8520134.1 SRPBCC domain-containing protein [Aquimarina acroporae]
MFNSKIIIVILVLIVILVILYFTGKKSVHHEVVIDASSEKVWMVLIDTNSYKEWNPVMKLIAGEVREGNEVTYQFTQDVNNQSEIPATVIKIEPNVLLNQAGGIPMVLTYNHKYSLVPLENQTMVVIHEDYKGIGVNFWNPKPVEEAYAKLNNALKTRVESLN